LKKESISNKSNASKKEPNAHISFKQQNEIIRPNSIDPIEILKKNKDIDLNVEKPKYKFSLDEIQKKTQERFSEFFNL